MNENKHLLNKLNEYISGKLTFDELQNDYYFYYHDLNEGALSDDEEDFHMEITEKMDWTGKRPNGEEREIGWIDYQEFSEWLKGYVHAAKKSNKSMDLT